ncbi:hypothetical protein ETD83_09075 [Actinomadura soli]|uniref:Uncharacterized protein n=1 Tax=Actinomadura soli TaxID=2508997 RepID=A0A5C4JGI3_9ACTN|nr:hypothetical protein [Actinomadura soli]TMR04224.1 hypothetical protein ETD83_09075 [Actinomadura soli]
MATKFPHQNLARVTTKSKTTQRPPGEHEHSPPPVPSLADRACCCPAMPVMVAVMPITDPDPRRLLRTAR